MLNVWYDMMCTDDGLVWAAKSLYLQLWSELHLYGVVCYLKCQHILSTCFQLMRYKVTLIVIQTYGPHRVDITFYIMRSQKCVPRQKHWEEELANFIFTQGQFWPSGIVIACVCVCVCPCVWVGVSLCVNHLLVRAITRDPFKLGSLNLDQRCKRPWLRSLSFLGVIDLDIHGQIKLQSQNLPYVELVRVITHHPFGLGPPNLDQRCKIPWLKCLLF